MYVKVLIMAHMVSLLGFVESIGEELQRLCSKVLRSSRIGSQRAGGAQSCSLKNQSQLVQKHHPNKFMNNTLEGSE